MTRPTVRDDVALMDGYHSPQLDVAIRLNTNEAPEPPPAAFRERLAAELATVQWHRYPDRGASRLRARIAAVEGVGPANVFAANGSNEVLQTLLLAYGGHGRRALTAEPTYALHSHLARVTGTAAVSVQRHDDFSLDVGRFVAAISDERPSVVFLCSPNNPTGMVESAETVTAVAHACDAAGAVLVVDEAYGQFAAWSALSLLAESLPLVVTRTFSKTWSMAAARLGYLCGPTWLVAELDKVVLPYHLDAAKQLAGEIALDYVAEMRSRVASLVEERGRVSQRLAELPVEQWASEANFILFRPLGPDGDEVWSKLVERSILVRNCTSWPGLPGCLRVTLGTPDENQAFCDALAEILEAR